jgi:hypothetical protein
LEVATLRAWIARQPDSTAQDHPAPPDGQTGTEWSSGS